MLAIPATPTRDTIVRRLAQLRRRVAGRIVFTTSFGLEDQALTDAIVASGIDVAFTTLETGRLFAETYELWAATERRYDRSLFLEALSDYQGMMAEDLHDHLAYFLREIVPVAEECGVRLCIHPDDPAFPLLAYSMTFGAYAWVCARASVGPGVNMGEGAVLGLASVATRDLEPWTVYAGAPAVRIKERQRGDKPGS